MKILETIGGRIVIFLILILIGGGVIYFVFMKEKNNNILPDVADSSVVLQTNFGEIEIEFFADQAPRTVENFIKLAEENFYDGTKFHRVMKGFMIQGGDPLTKNDEQKMMWGTGGPGYKFEDEIYDGNSNVLGTVAMANAGPNTNGSQFFINVANNNFLDQKHTVFGKVIRGMEIVHQIENVAVGAKDIPLEAVVVESISVK